MSDFRSFVGLILLGAVIFITAPSVHADEATSSSFTIHNSTVTESGGVMTSPSFQYIGATGQLVTGEASGSSFASQSGALYYGASASSPVVTAIAAEASIALSWTDSIGQGATVTEYQYGTATSSGGPYTFTSNGLLLSTEVSGLAASTTYYFKVRVYSGATLLVESSVVSSTTTAPPDEGGGGGGGGGGQTNGSSGIALSFSGRAYPNTVVTLMQDARIVGTATADEDAFFTISLSRIVPGAYTFSLYGEDYEGVRSSLHTFAIGVEAGAYTVGGIYIPPTISVDQTEVKQGESVQIFGQSAPNSTVTIAVHSDTEYSVQALADTDGIYFYHFDTTPLELGRHTAKSRSAAENEMSGLSSAVEFLLSENPEAATEVTYFPGDLNEDGDVDLIDFSIAAYWYGRSLSDRAKELDVNHLNGDGVYNIVDMSIIAYYWSG